jgi:putative intracellular protease/amidase
MTRVVAFLQPGMADWEAGPVLALLRGRCGVQILAATPDGVPITTVAGLCVKGDVAFAKVSPEDADAFVLVGSDAWAGYHDTNFLWLLQGAAAQGKVIGAICAGTIAAARSGVLDRRAHTSNGGAWLRERAGAYPGADHYVESPRAVTDGRIITAPGSAAASFAAAFARLVAPRAATTIDAFEAAARREWAA